MESNASESDQKHKIKRLFSHPGSYKKMILCTKNRYQFRNIENE